MSLDLDNNNQAYLCGRLMAVYEKIQREAMGAVNTSIVDMFYDTFSSTPNLELRRLDALSRHFIKKLDKAQQAHYENAIGELMNRLSSKGLPAHFSLDDQSRFAIGYYQQRQELYKKKEEPGKEKK